MSNVCNSLFIVPRWTRERSVIGFELPEITARCVNRGKAVKSIDSTSSSVNPTPIGAFFLPHKIMPLTDTDHKKRASCDRLESARRGCLVHRLLGEAILKPFPSLSGSCNGMMGQRRLAPSFSSPWRSNSQTVSFAVWFMQRDDGATTPGLAKLFSNRFLPCLVRAWGVWTRDDPVDVGFSFLGDVLPCLVHARKYRLASRFR